MHLQASVERLRCVHPQPLDRAADEGHALRPRGPRPLPLPGRPTTSSTPELEREVGVISRIVNAFFRWEFNSCETIVKDATRPPDRLRERLARHRPRQPPLPLPLGDPLARRLVRVLLGERPLDAPEPAHARVLRGRRPRRPRLRGEAGALRRAGRHLLPGRRVRGVPRSRPPPPRRADASTTSRARSSTSSS